MAIDFYTELPRIAEMLLRHYPHYPEEWATREELLRALNGGYTSRDDFALSVLRRAFMGDGLAPGIAAFLHVCVCLDLTDLN